MARLSSRYELSIQLREERPLLRKVGDKVPQGDVHQRGWMEEVLKRRLLEGASLTACPCTYRTGGYAALRTASVRAEVVISERSPR